MRADQDIRAADYISLKCPKCGGGGTIIVPAVI
jgi:phage FluMu protein Com